ncbi:MAG: hypothetical protein AAGA99_26335 [Actinomycetota bacterium]
MTGTDIELVDTSPRWVELVPPAMQLAEQIARTDFVPSGLRGKPEAVMAAVLTGDELGIGPMQALSKIHVVDGRPALAAELMRALALQQGHEFWVEETSNTKVTVAGRRSNSSADVPPTRVTWTLDDAKQAGLNGRQNWRKYPRAMLLARATGELCRLIFPDVLAGISYTSEELTDGDVVDDGDVVAGELEAATTEDEPTKPKRSRKQGGHKRAAKKRAASRSGAPATPASAPAGAPPLPGEDGYDDDPTGRAPAAEEDADEGEWRERRHRKLMATLTELGLNDDDVRHALVRTVTNGRITSSSDVTDDEADRLLRLLDQIKEGRVEIDHTAGAAMVTLLDVAADTVLGFNDNGQWGPLLDDGDVIDAEVVDETDAGEWDEASLRKELRARGIKVASALKAAQGIDQSIGSIGDLAERPDIVELVLGGGG